jgi:hypothetical protein
LQRLPPTVFDEECKAEQNPVDNRPFDFKSGRRRMDLSD